MTVTDAIVQALHREFGDGYEIYTENVEQGLREPCFLIETIETSGGQYRGIRHKRELSFCIHYFPVSQEPEEECNNMADRLIDLLEVIPFGDGKIRGTKMSGKVEDSVLNFLIEYNRFTIKAREGEKMKHVDIDVKGENRC